MTVAAARLVAVGSQAFVRGVVVAEGGRLGTPPLVVVGGRDGRPAGPSAGWQRRRCPAGTLVELRGPVADPYGQTELRPPSDGDRGPRHGRACPTPVGLTAGQAGEGTEGRLAAIRGTITAAPAKSTSGDIAFTIEGTDGAVPAHRTPTPSAGLDASVLRKGASATLHRDRRPAGVAQGRARRLPRCGSGTAPTSRA